MLRLISIFLLLIFFASATPTSALTAEEWKVSAPGNFTTLTKNQVDEVMNPIMNNGTYAGAVVILVDQNGSAIYEYGLADRTLMTKPDKDTLYSIGSISKIFTGLLLADEAIKGELNLKAPIQQYVPAGVTIPVFNGREITLEDLATHTSGLPGVPDQFAVIPENLSSEDQTEALFTSYETLTAKEAYDFVHNYTLTRQPGTSWEYSNLGAAIAGNIAAQTTSTTYGNLLKERILSPLGMNHTTIILTDDDRSHMATGYRGYATPIDQAKILEFNDFWAASGGIYSTGDDMVTLIAAQTGIIDTPFPTAIHLTHQPRAVRSEGPPETREGLFWDIIQGTDGVRVYLKAGETNGYQADIGLIPDEKIGVVILANTAYMSEQHVQGLVVSLLQKMHGKPFA